MSSSQCSLSATKDQVKQRQSRFALICALPRELMLFSSSRAKASSGMRSVCCTFESVTEREPKLEDVEVEVEEEGGEEKVEDMVEERGKRGGAGDAAPTVLQRSVKQLHFGGWEEKEAAAAEIRRIARRDRRARRSLAALGVIPSLVSMLDSDDERSRRLAVQALIELANGSFTYVARLLKAISLRRTDFQFMVANGHRRVSKVLCVGSEEECIRILSHLHYARISNKALMVEAGVLKSLPRLVMKTRDTSRRKECLVLLFSVSSLAKTHFHVDAGDFLPLLVEILDDGPTVDELKLTCLGTLYNLSIKLGNARAIVSEGAVPTLVRLLREKAASEMALAALGNLVVTAMGRTAIEEDEMVPRALFEMVTWEDKPRSQELAVYVLMVLAQGSAMQRRKMAETGLVPLLLELALLGTPLARKRALKTLHWFKMDTQTKMAGHDRPQARKSAVSIDTMVVDEREPQEYRNDVKKMVKQSLHKNMENITRRATVRSVPEDALMPTSPVVLSSTKRQP